MKEHNTDPPMTPESKPAQDEVAKRAYAIYQKEGRPEGHEKRSVRMRKINYSMPNIQDTMTIILTWRQTFGTVSGFR